MQSPLYFYITMLVIWRILNVKMWIFESPSKLLQVKQMCEGRQTCTIRPTSRMFGVDTTFIFRHLSYFDTFHTLNNILSLVFLRVAFWALLDILLPYCLFSSLHPNFLGDMPVRRAFLFWRPQKEAVGNLLM